MMTTSYDRELIIEKLKEINFPKDEYWIIAGGAMVMYGFRPSTRDIDIGCTTKLADKLEQEGYPTTPYKNKLRRIEYSETIELFEGWTENTADLIEGIPVITIEGLIKMKERLGREKDLRDIELIKSHLGVSHVAPSDKDI